MVSFGGNTGKIAGRVTEAITGEALVGAIISIPNTPIGTFSDYDGYYHIINLPPGNYSLKVHMIGYVSVTMVDVRCNIDLTTKANFKLKMSPIETGGITVTAERAIVDKDLTATLRVIKGSDLDKMPWDNPQQAVAAQSGVLKKGEEFYIRGGRSDEVDYLIDGVSVRDVTEGYAGLLFNTNSLSELSLLTGTFNAEYGEVMSGVINATIKDGSEKGFHFSSNKGSVFPDRIGRGYRNYQGDIGYNIFDNRFRIFSSGDLTLSNDWDPHKESVPHQDREDYSTLVKSVILLPAQIRLTTLLAQSRSQYGKYSHEWYFLPNSYRSDFKKGRLGMLVLNQSLSNSMFYQLTAGMFWNQAKFGVRDTFWDINRYWWEDIKFLNYWDNQIYYDLDSNLVFSADYNHYGYDRTLFYRYGSYWKHRDRTTAEKFIKLDFTNQLNKRHQLKMGFDFKWYQINNLYLYSSALAAPIFDSYHYNPSSKSVFAQDKIEFEGLVLNIGLRYHRFNPKVGDIAKLLWYENVKSSDISTQQALSPRIGLSYVASPITTFHMGYGRYFQQPQLQHMYQYLSAENVFEIKGNVMGNPALKPSTTTSLEFGAVTELSKSWSVDVTLYNKDIRNLIGVGYYTVDTNYYYQYDNIDFATSRGIELSLKKHSGRYFVGSVKYTISNSEGTGSSADAAWEGYLSSANEDSLGNINREAAPMDFDQRNKLVVEMSAFTGEDLVPGRKVMNKVISNFNLNAILNYGSGLPYTPSTLDKLSKETADFDNQRHPATKQCDVKLIKKITIQGLRTEFSLEVINIFNWNNYNYSYKYEISPYEIYFTNWYPAAPTVDYFNDSPYYDPLGDSNKDGVFSKSEQQNIWNLYNAKYNNNPLFTGAPRLFRLGLNVKF
jgi:outer membrane cobalamin receptor